MYPYNKDILVENCSIYDLYDDGFILAQAERITLRNTSIINTWMLYLSSDNTIIHIICF